MLRPLSFEVSCGTSSVFAHAIELMLILRSAVISRGVQQQSTHHSIPIRRSTLLEAERIPVSIEVEILASILELVAENWCWRSSNISQLRDLFCLCLSYPTNEQVRDGMTTNLVDRARILYMGCTRRN